MSIEARLRKLEEATRTEGAGWVVYEDAGGVLTVGGDVVTPDELEARTRGKSTIRVTYVKQPIPERTSK